MSKNYNTADFFLELETIEKDINDYEKLMLESDGSSKNPFKILEHWFEHWFSLSSYLAKYLVTEFIEFFYQILIINKSEYDPVLSQKINDFLGTSNLKIKIFNDDEFNTYSFPGNEILVADSYLKYFNHKEIALAIVFNLKISKMIKTLDFAKIPTTLFLMNILLRFAFSVQKKLGYKQESHSIFLNKLIEVIYSQIAEALISLSLSTPYKRMLETAGAKEIKRLGMEKEFVSYLTKKAKIKRKIEPTRLGKAMIKFESLFNTKPREKEVLKKVFDDPEKVDIIIKTLEKLSSRA